MLFNCGLRTRPIRQPHEHGAHVDDERTSVGRRHVILINVVRCLNDELGDTTFKAQNQLLLWTRF
jgi:hypothetical protein